jgi:predicted Ser/Thr protein kinase
MESRNPDVDKLIDLIADGAQVDWPALLAGCRDDGERQLVEQFRVMSEVARATDPLTADVGAPGGGDSPPSRPPLFTWGQLEVFEELGRGTFGRVFRARDPRLDREVALKLFAQTAVAEPSFVREAQLLARMRHPHVVAVYGADAFGGTDGLSMELIRGRSLRAIVQDQGPFGPRETALIALDLCAALAAVHGAGLAHRDIKANNVMREVGGRIVLMDFGAGLPSAEAKSADAGTTGTPLYMAPELFAGAEASVSTDLYALGVLLFFLVTGDYPVHGRNVADLRDAHSRGIRRWLRDARPDVPATLAQVIDRALSPDPSARFRTAADMEQALAATLDVHGHARVHDTTTAIGWRHWISQPVPAWMTLIALVGAVVVTAWVGPQVARLRESRDGGQERSNSPAAGRAPKALSAAQWEIIEGNEELAATLADGGHWKQAAEQYDKVKALLTTAGWQDEPYRAHVMAMLGWAQIHAGKSDDARTNIALALYRLAEEGGANHPLRATFEMASALEHHARGDQAGAAAAIIRAVNIRRGALAEAGVAIKAVPALDLARLTQALSLDGPDRDGDGDWLPDVIERVVGLDPMRRDSDGNGVPDDEEDIDHDGLSNGLEWAIVADPTRVLAHFGRLDPERAGYRRVRAFVGSAVPSAGNRGPAWKVTADRQGFYYQTLDQLQKREAMTRGWRLVSVGALWSGVAFANVDFIPAAARFDQNFFIHSDGQLWMRATSSVMPREGPVLHLGSPGRWPAVESVFDPSNRSATILAGGTRFQIDYHGHRQFQEDYGLFFGSDSNVGTAPRGEADFSLILLQIR